MTISTSTEFAEARHTLGLTVRACAALCKVDERTIRRWEIGRGNTTQGRDPAPSACRILELALRDPGAMLIWRTHVGTGD